MKCSPLHQCLFFIFFILANFRNLQTQKKRKEEGRIQQRDFWDLNKQIRHILTKKTLEVARTRQDSKKDLLVPQDSRHLLLIN